MVLKISAAGVALAASLAGTPAWAQHEGHQMPGMSAPAPAAAASVSTCAQNARGITKAIEATNARIEEARQVNDPTRLRAAIGDLQLVLTQIKAQIADCVDLADAAPGGAAMAGMDHSMMHMGAAAAPPAARDEQAGTFNIAFTTSPSPPRAGDNRFEVVVKDKDGKVVSGATVSLAFYMPPMPSMNMPAMRNTVVLTSAGNGVYQGEGTIMMAGGWDVTITVTRGQATLASTKVTLTAR